MAWPLFVRFRRSRPRMNGHVRSGETDPNDSRRDYDRGANSEGSPCAVINHALLLRWHRRLAVPLPRSPRSIGGGFLLAALMKRVARFAGSKSRWIAALTAPSAMACDREPFARQVEANVLGQSCWLWLRVNRRGARGRPGLSYAIAFFAINFVDAERMPGLIPICNKLSEQLCAGHGTRLDLGRRLRV